MSEQLLSWRERLRACWLILSASPVEIRIRMWGSKPW